VSSFVLILTFGISTAWCGERLVRARNPAWCLLALPTLIGSWAWLLTLRLPPSPELALVAFTLADGAVLALSVLGVLRLLGGFERWDDPSDEDDGDDDSPPVLPGPPNPSGRRPARRAIRPRHTGPRPGARPARGRNVSA
jgi:hypothetical protein